MYGCHEKCMCNEGYNSKRVHSGSEPSRSLKMGLLIRAQQWQELMQQAKSPWKFCPVLPNTINTITVQHSHKYIPCYKYCFPETSHSGCHAHFGCKGGQKKKEAANHQ